MAIRRVKCECGMWFSTGQYNRLFCSPSCKDRVEYWRQHVEPFLLRERMLPPKPWMFCRAGDHHKCPGVLTEGICPCTRCNHVEQVA